MIVYNLACAHLHPFEGWFGSPADFENQRDRGLVECPVCGSTKVERKLHAPRLNLGAQQSVASANSEAGAAAESKQSLAIALAAEATQAAMNSGVDIDIAKLREAMVTFAENVRENTEYVGEKFAEEARAMHYGEKPLKGIRGRVDKETAQELREEGITFRSLPFPVDFPNTH